MSRCTPLFLALALVAALLGIGGLGFVAAGAATIAQGLFFVFVIPAIAGGLYHLIDSA